MPKIIVAGSEGEVGMAAAVAALQAGLPALDVVEISIRPVESDPAVRSVGVGGWPNLLGQVELDASIMDGVTLETGAVGALQGYVYPISVARQVMERLPHVFLVGEGAARFAAECGAERGQVLTEEARQEWEQWLEAHVPAGVRASWPDVPLAGYARLTVDPETGHGTTISLVRDTVGNIAVGVSTCGWGYKYPGRLGDSPVIGAGCYADNRYGAAACTGTGELAIRAGTARAVVLYMKMGMSPQEACHEAFADMRALRRRYAGGVTVHVIDAQGQSYIATIGRGGGWPYCIWTEGMSAPENRVAVFEDW